MIAGLAASLPQTLSRGLEQHSVPYSVARQIASLPRSSRQVLTGREFFPQLISGSFHQGLVIALSVSAGLAVLAGLASLLRGGAISTVMCPPAQRPSTSLTKLPSSWRTVVSSGCGQRR